MSVSGGEARRCGCKRLTFFPAAGSRSVIPWRHERCLGGSMAKGRKAGLRLETAVRDQVGFEVASLDELLPKEHRAREVWTYVEGLDLSEFYDKVRSVVGGPGRPGVDPAVVTALWLYATLEGVGSARLLERLCERDIAYRWICGRVGFNRDLLATFRREAGPMLDRLLTDAMASLIKAGIVDIDVLAVD